MGKYLSAFRISATQLLTYRLNFLLGRVRSLLILGILLSLWQTLTRFDGFAGYTAEELTTYVILAHLLRAAIFGSQSRRIAEEINDGTFSAYLVKPINHFLFFYFRELAERLILLITATIEILVLIHVLQIELVARPLSLISVSLVSVFFAHLLYFTLSYAVNLLAFWSREALGPRFLFEWFLEFASGAYFPLTLLPPAFMLGLFVTPFPSLIFAPISLWLGAPCVDQILLQLFWIGVMAIAAAGLWQRGLRQYTGEGI